MSRTKSTDRQRASRRKFIHAAGAAGIVSLSGCSGGDGESGTPTSDPSGTDGSDSDGADGATTDSSVELADEITVATWGGGYGEAHNKAYFETFEEEFGVTVNHEKTNMVNLMSKIKAGSKTNVDWVDLVTFNAFKSIKDGSLQQFRRDNLPALDSRLLPKFQPNNWPINPSAYKGENAIWTIPMQYNAIGVGYNKNKLSKPSSWNDILSNDLKNESAFYSDVSQTVGVNALIAGLDPNKLEENYDSKMEQVWKVFSEQNDYARTWFDSWTTHNDAMAQGSTLAGHQLMGRVSQLWDQDLPIGIHHPKEGSVMGGTTAGIPHYVEDPKRRTAEKLTNWAMQEDPSHTFAENINYAQPIQFDKMPSVYDKNIDMQYVDRLVAWNPEIVSNHLEEWKANFQQVIRA